MTSSLIPSKRIQNSIYLIRGERVMIDRDLAVLYGVQTKVLKQAVRRNIERFPSDFMFLLDRDEFSRWRSQFVTSNADRKGLRYAPMAFTEHGVAMLSTVLRSKRAVSVNIEIMRTFVRLRHMLVDNTVLAQKLEQLEQKYDRKFKIVFDALRELMTPAQPARKEIGFRAKAVKK